LKNVNNSKKVLTFNIEIYYQRLKYNINILTIFVLAIPSLDYNNTAEQEKKNPKKIVHLMVKLN
jgi:hypothetical protein